MGMRSGPRPRTLRDKAPVEYRTYLEASPVHHVSADDAPILLIHGDQDPTVPFEQSELMEKALRQAGVETKLLRIPGGVHGGTFGKPKDAPDYLGEMVRWFDQHLRNSAAK
jgi:dipeptidyl aminopeptidase/acylaminoacyl peptidase